MDQIIPAYDDPLFSILLLVTLALIVAVLSYGWSLYKRQKEEGSLLKFLEKFDSKECLIDTKNLPYDPKLLKPLTLLAKAHETAGEYHKAIGLYNYLIRHQEHFDTKLELLQRLGRTYLDAGFLERAESIFLEVLRQKPRNKYVLESLGMVYEQMHRFDAASEVIDPLEELGVETKTLKSYLKLQKLLHDNTTDNALKAKTLKTLLQEAPELYRPALEALFKYDANAAWEMIDTDRLDEILDILWFLPGSQLRFDIICQDPVLSTLYFARGHSVQYRCESGRFSLDLLATARAGKFEYTELHFTYLCRKCKRSFPVSFLRCPNCKAVGTVKVEEHIAKPTPKTSHSLL